MLWFEVLEDEGATSSSGFSVVDRLGGSICEGVWLLERDSFLDIERTLVGLSVCAIPTVRRSSQENVDRGTGYRDVGKVAAYILNASS